MHALEKETASRDVAAMKKNSKLSSPLSDRGYNTFDAAEAEAMGVYMELHD